MRERFGQTPQELGIKKGTIAPPREGWKESTWYLVEVAYCNANPIHRSLFYTGFLEGKTPAGYHQLISTTTPKGGGFENNELRHVYYLKAIKKLFSADELDAI